MTAGAAKTGLDEPRGAVSETARRFQPPRIEFGKFEPQHFLWQLEGKVATITLNRPERKNPLTLESYAELRDTFRDPSMPRASGVVSRGGFLLGRRCAWRIIGPLWRCSAREYVRVCSPSPDDGDLVKAMRACPQ